MELIEQEGRTAMPRQSQIPSGGQETGVDRAPPADRFPVYPSSWYLFCRSSEVASRPFSKSFLGKHLVAYRATGEKLVVMDAKCSHLGSDLGAGKVVGDVIKCPFHDWEYGSDGRCTRIPAQREIPGFARQACYPVEERNGLVFIFNDEVPLFPLPFFANCRPEELRPSRPFGTVLDCPWYVSGANAFDLQHFRAAHDRRLVSDPVTDQPSTYSFRALGVFAVEGHSIQDRITRKFAGDQVSLGITDWCGSLSFATAEFARTTTYGLVAREPLPDGKVKIQVIVFARRSNNTVSKLLIDPLQLAVRRYFIKTFLTADAIRLNGVSYEPEHLIEADRDMIQYYKWLAKTCHLASDKQEISSHCGLNKSESECNPSQL
jgi:phenylpropionate dioxygenase-like ring-hydroxylating dioxygenase large terminal subunit